MIPEIKKKWNISALTLEEMLADPPRYRFDIGEISKGVFKSQEAVLKKYRAEMHVQEATSPEGFHIMRAKLKSTDDGFIYLNPAKPYVHILFNLNNNRSYYVGNRSLGKLGEYEHQIFLFQGEEITGIWDSGKDQQFLEINMSYPFFNELLPKEWPFAKCLRRLTHGRTSTAVFAKPLPLNADMIRLLDELLANNVAGCMRGLHIKAKLLELIAIQLDQYEHVSFTSQFQSRKQLSHETLERMGRAKTIIERRLDNPPSLADLAFMLGTNENYLQKHFKECYGYTIYGYINQLRMVKAMDLLREKDKPIAEIARFLGYSSASHFSNSFKKHYGYNPKKVHKAVI